MILDGKLMVCHKYDTHTLQVNTGPGFVPIANILPVLLISPTKSIFQHLNLCFSYSERLRYPLSDSWVLTFMLENEVFK